jgi:hypothetical protein
VATKTKTAKQLAKLVKKGKRLTSFQLEKEMQKMKQR